MGQSQVRQQAVGKDGDAWLASALRNPSEATKAVQPALDSVSEHTGRLDSTASLGLQQGEKAEVHQIMMSANPITEALGNARTLRNDNSSRFGRFVKLFLNAAGEIECSEMSIYSLEKPILAMKRSASDALVATAEPKSGQQLRLPLLLFLSPRIPVDQAADVRVLVASKPQYASLSDSEEGALLVLPDFQQEDSSALEKRKKRVVGLPFVQRFLQDPGLLSKVPALPLFDLIYRCPGALCFSAMEPRQRARSQSLAKWMGARYTQDAGPGTELLVAARVSIHPDSKYQEALARRIPIVKPSYLEAVWEAKHLVDVQAHHLLPLAGLAICFDADCSGDGEGLKNGAIASGEPWDAKEWEDFLTG
eukprot:g19541.t1